MWEEGGLNKEEPAGACAHSAWFEREDKSKYPM